MMKIGVIISRFQVPHLHEAHRMLISYVKQRNDIVVILLGTTQARLTRNNPLNFDARRDMVLSDYPEVTVFPLADQKDDTAWSKTIDALIAEHFPQNDIDVVLYGGRNSFIDSYKGKLRTEKMEYDMTNISGTQIRRGVQLFQESSVDWRKGVIHASTYRYPVSFQTVDIAILRIGEVLLGRKKHEQKYRFVGGFVSPEDASLESAASRELIEECGKIETDGPRYIGSYRIDDWRYRNEQDKILTSFFVTQFMFGSPQASDDIHELKWFALTDLYHDRAALIEPEHEILVWALEKYLTS